MKVKPKRRYLYAAAGFLAIEVEGFLATSLERPASLFSLEVSSRSGLIASSKNENLAPKAVFFVGDIFGTIILDSGLW